MKELTQEVKESATFVARHLPGKPRVAMILGSGLGAFAGSLRALHTLPYEKIPHFPVSTAPGHAGRLCLGRVGSIEVLAMQGRIHFYEGYPMSRVTYPVRVFAALGVQTLVVTNASGAVNPSFRPGDMVVLRDQINLMGDSPLHGNRADTHFNSLADMSEPYDPEYSEIALRLGLAAGLRMQRGVAGAVTGPSYETPAEIRMLRRIGSDTVSMSTAPEVAVARSLGLRVLGISCITNLASGVSPQPLDHEEVLEVTRRVSADFQRLLTDVILEIGN